VIFNHTVKIERDGRSGRPRFILVKSWRAKALIEDCRKIPPVFRTAPLVEGGKKDDVQRFLSRLDTPRPNKRNPGKSAACSSGGSAVSSARTGFRAVRTVQAYRGGVFLWVLYLHEQRKYLFSIVSNSRDSRKQARCSW